MHTDLRTFFAVALISMPLSAGCLVELPETTEGQFWCVKAVGANGNDASNEPHPIITPDGKTVAGCWSMCPFEHDIMVEGEINETIEDDQDPLWDQWQFLRGLVYNAGETICENRVDQMEEVLGPLTFTAMGNLSCADAVAAQPVYEGSKVLLDKSYCGGGGATTSGSGGTGTGGADESTGMMAEGPEIYGLTSYSEVLYCSGSINRTCYVVPAFAADLEDQPTLLWKDDMFLEEETGPPAGFEFTTCGSDSLMYAAGFRVNDLVTHVDGFAVTNWDEALELWGYITASEHETVKADFLRSGRDYTLTINKCSYVNMACTATADCCSGMICNINDVCVEPT